MGLASPLHQIILLEYIAFCCPTGKLLLLPRNFGVFDFMLVRLDEIVSWTICRRRGMESNWRWFEVGMVDMVLSWNKAALEMDT